MFNNLHRRRFLKMTGGFVAGFSAALLPSYVSAQGYLKPRYRADRKNVKYLTPYEKTAFVNAIKTLKTTIPEGGKVSIYDQFVAIHVESMGFTLDMGSMQMTSASGPAVGADAAHQHAGFTSGMGSMQMTSASGPAVGADAAHQHAGFLPWHREYLRRFEEALQSVNPSVAIPYWDWTDPEALDVVFRDDFMGPNGKGVIFNDATEPGSFEGGPVLSGPFSEANGWVLNPDLHVRPTGESMGTALLRFMLVPPTNNYPMSKADVDQILAVGNYDTFRPALEGYGKLDNQGQLTIPGRGFAHNYIHALVGGVIVNPDGSGTALGTMGSVVSSPNDPSFWLHHAFVDLLWAKWQENGHEGSAFYPSSGQPYGHNLNDPMWPWDGGQSTPRNVGPGDLLSLLPVFAPDDIVTPADVLEFRELGYRYDTTSSYHHRVWQPKVH